MSADGSEPGLYKDVRFYAIGDLSQETKELLESGGAKEETYLSGSASHAIVTDFKSIDLEEAQDCWQIPTVTERWVHLSSKCKSLLPVEGFTPSNSQLFSGVVVCPSQMEKSDRDLIWAFISFYGGSCQLNLTNNCTHLVVPKPEGAKYQEALKHPDIVTPVTPDWIVNSVKAKKLEDVKEYHPSLVILPEPKTATEVPETHESESNVISSSLQKISVNAGDDSSKLSSSTTSTVSSRTEQVTPVAPSIPPSVQQIVTANTPMPQTNVTAQQITTMPSMTTHDQAGQVMSHQTTQQHLATGQTTGKPQAMAMQQFQVQRQVAPTANQTRFSSPNLMQQQRFQGTINQQTPEPRPATPAPKKTPKRRRSSAKSKAKAQNATVPSSSMHVNQMTMMPQQQQYLQNQQMLMNQHRMTMMQQHPQPGQPGKVNFMPQQQIYQAQHFQGNMQGKPPSTSPQKQHTMINDQTGMRTYMPAGFQQGNMIRMQQGHQPRQMQVQGQMTQQQIMSVGYNPQMQQQIVQQQMKMIVPGQQQTNQMAQHQQQNVIMSRGVPMQNQMQGMNPGKIQQQRMQMSPQQQQAMLAQQQQQVMKDGLSPQQQQVMSQQQSPLKQQTQVIQQPLTPQQRQHVMQQIQVHNRQLQMQQQQQMMPTPGSVPQNPQKLAQPSVSHASISVGGMDMISPAALQQGLMMSQNSTFQQPLIHPSLQTPQDYGKVNSQGGGAKSRRSKSRKTKDGDENTEGKAKPKSRRPKKPSQSAGSASSPGNKKTISKFSCNRSSWWILSDSIKCHDSTSSYCPS